jgi:hypothetical protein
MSSVLYFDDHKIKVIVCCVLYMLVSFSLTEMHLCMCYEPKQVSDHFPFSNVDLCITYHNKCRYVAAHKFMILSFNSGTVDIELTVSTTVLLLFSASFALCTSISNPLV